MLGGQDVNPGGAIPHCQPQQNFQCAPVVDGAEIARSVHRPRPVAEPTRPMVTRMPPAGWLDTARTLIVKEIAIAREQTEDQVKNEIESIRAYVIKRANEDKALEAGKKIARR